MYVIIMHQKQKSLGEIMYILKVDGIKKFRRKEKIKFGIFILVILFMLTGKIVHRALFGSDLGSIG